jgi:putative Mn2+ efflux pump MntP
VKTFKLVDIITSTCLIIGGFAVTIIGYDKFLLAYFIVGGWQVISMIVHRVDGRFANNRVGRTYYHYFAGVFLICLGIAFLMLLFKMDDSGFLLVCAVIAAVVSPIMAIYYTGICIREWIDWKKGRIEPVG